MKIAISSTGASLDAQMDQRFGRCPFFVITGPEGTDQESIDNPHAQLGHGAGIQTARMLIERGVTVVLTGRCGPNATEVLDAGNVEIVTGLGGTARQALESYGAGAVQYTPVRDSTAADFGTRVQGGQGPGRGMGVGSRRGRGRGMGAPVKPGR